VTHPAAVTKTGADIVPGDRVRLPSGRQLTVTRVRQRLLGRDDLLCLIEDTDDSWFAHGVRATAEIDVIRDTERSAK
jgi:hypothetical protein